MNANRKYFTKAQTIVELLSYLMLIAAFAVSLYYAIRYSGQQVPMHYNLQGEVDRYGNAGSLMIMPIIMLFCEVMISLIAHFMPANLWNMPFKVNPKNAISVYHCMIWMMVILELLLSAFTLLAIICMIAGWVGGENILTILLVIGVFADIIIFCILAGRYNRM